MKFEPATMAVSLGFLDIAGLFQWIVSIFIWLAGIFGSVYAIHFLFSLPMRRAEKARLFLDLLEDVLKRGQSIEEMFLSLVRSREREVGIGLHFLAAHIEDGLQFEDALKKVPGFLPPQISAMLLAGLKLGDVRRVIPACREILRDHPAGVRSALHYMLLVVFIFSPAFIVLMILTTVFVIPRFKDVAAGTEATLWPETLFVFANGGLLIACELLVFAFIVAATAAYIGGPRFVRVFQARVFPLVDWLAWRISWKKKRLQRTFSAMLAVLLDGGVPEAEAVRLAGNCTANEICRRRVNCILDRLQQGTNLNDAIRAFDETGEFHWRFTNAAHGRAGFLAALRGWHEALDAKAFQQEEATAHGITTGIVIFNGVVVALIATAMFGMLVAIAEVWL
jgi:type II secretory pathway component PulF